MRAPVIVLLFVVVVICGSFARELPQRPGQKLSYISQCNVRTNIAQEFLPLVFQTGEISNVVLPTSKTRRRKTTISYSLLASDVPYKFSCSGAGNRFRYFDVQKMDVRCNRNGQLETEYGVLELDNLVCSGRAGETVSRNGTCYNGYTKIDIAFPSYTWIEVCHNEELSETLWAKHVIDGPRLSQGESVGRPDFQEAIFYPEIDTDGCYKTVKQTETVGLILGSSALASDYIQPGANLFFSRGHLTPNGDGIPAEEKLATFYFVNANPQWQTINGGNWNQLEIKLRTYAEQNQARLTVYTGSWGATTLKDINGDPQEIWLGRDVNDNLVKRLPAPRALYKVVLNPDAGTGVAVVQINNPYQENHYPEDILCESICDQLPWVTWKVADYRLGYTYCCTVADFYAAHPIIPNPGNPSLMV